MKIVSLFDGISCGRVALERVGIKVDRYASYEIDKYATAVSRFNHPDIEHCGDVVDADFTKYRDFDIVMGGFPCTDLSVAKNNRQGLKGAHSSLFWHLVRAIREVKPKYFLVENNYGMPPEDYRIICEELGCEPIMINSALVSAQTRKRYYWTNIGEVSVGLFGDKKCGIKQPEDRGILLRDGLESGMAINTIGNKCRTIKAQYAKNNANNGFRTSTFGATMISQPVFNVNPSRRGMNGQVYSTEAKSPCVTVNKGEGIKIIEPVIYQRGRGFNNGGIHTDKSPTLTSCSWQDNNKIIEPARLGHFGKGGQGERIYSVRGKSIALSANGGGGGGKTGLYKIDLPDGDYTIRKLTPIECERLQTLPDNYTAKGIDDKGNEIKISNNQRYKQIGNGWTVDVIAHILKHITL